MFSLRDFPSLNVTFTPAGGRAREGVQGAVTQHWWVEDMGSSQLEQFTGFSTGVSASSLILIGVNIRGAGEGKLFTLCGESEDKKLSGEDWLLSASFSGDSTSFSFIWKSDLILWAKGEQLVGDGADGELESVRFPELRLFSGKGLSACKRLTQAEAAWRSDPFIGGGREDVAKAALCITERLKLFLCLEQTLGEAGTGWSPDP